MIFPYKVSVGEYNRKSFIGFLRKLQRLPRWEIDERPEEQRYLLQKCIDLKLNLWDGLKGPNKIKQESQ